MSDIGFHILAIIGMGSAWWIFCKTGSRTVLVCTIIAAVLWMGSLFCDEAADHYKDAGREAIKAAVEIAVGAAHVIDSPGTAMVYAIDAGTHLSQALEALKAALEAQQRTNALQAGTIPQGSQSNDPDQNTGTLDRDMQYEPDRSGPDH